MKRKAKTVRNTVPFTLKPGEVDMLRDEGLLAVKLSPGDQARRDRIIERWRTQAERNKLDAAHKETQSILADMVRLRRQVEGIAKDGADIAKLRAEIERLRQGSIHQTALVMEYMEDLQKLRARVRLLEFHEGEGLDEGEDEGLDA